MFSLPAPRNWVQKKGAKRRSRRSWNWLCSCCIPGSMVSRLRGEIVLDRGQRGAHFVDIGPEVDLLADLFTLQDAGVAQYAQVVRHRRARQRRRRHDLADVEPLARLEHEQDALAMRVAERDEDARDASPGRGQRSRVGSLHSRVTS